MSCVNQTAMQCLSMGGGEIPFFIYTFALCLIIYLAIILYLSYKEKI